MRALSTLKCKANRPARKTTRVHIGLSGSHFSTRRQTNLHIHCRWQNQIRQVHKIQIAYKQQYFAIRLLRLHLNFLFDSDQPSLHNPRQTHQSFTIFPLVALMNCKFFIAIPTYDWNDRRLIYLIAILDSFIVFSWSVVFWRMVYHHPSIRTLPSKLGSIDGSDQHTFIRSTSLNYFAQTCGPPIRHSIRCASQWGFPLCSPPPTNK